jgi:hypothetical protein
MRNNQRLCPPFPDDVAMDAEELREVLHGVDAKNFDQPMGGARRPRLKKLHRDCAVIR